MKFESGSYYHIYNRGVNSSQTFLSPSDFDFFLNKFSYYLSLSVEVYSYCILKNHFHFLIKVLDENEIQTKSGQISESEFDSYYILPNSTERPFPIHKLISHWLNSYSKYLNKKYSRTGPIWNGRLNKRRIDSEEYLQKVICYIHRNPIHHGITSNYSDYKLSSFAEILDNSSVFVSPDLVFKEFGGIKNFVLAHREFKGNFGEDDFKF